ncbi:NERD domain-containing protein [Halobacillus litoralis]|uniref:nuclease-related domain-containing protein n=1 Tax=Halobacillus litoralis TaxID=45668 RepID=UPI001CD40558|nr:nuclease-related domain-containing protein [Halobacillus litoralis]MCA0972444.1 NERD domain-containing protein [Halobacillus litoralis]
MIVKELDSSINFLSHEYLLSRIPPDHPEAPLIEENFSHHQAGFHGESSIPFHLQYIEDHHLTLYNLRLPDAVAHFQIDTLLLFPKYALILEVKNRTGQITIDRTSKQMKIIKEDGTSVGDTCPVEQTERQARLLKKWLKDYGLEMPVYHLVVMANKRCTLEFVVPEPLVIRATSLYNTIQNINPGGPGLKKDQLTRLAYALKEAHRDLIPNVMKRFGVKRRELINGVRCPGCGRYYMRRERYKWCCKYCNHESKSAHERALKEYAYLISPFITTNEDMKYLKISSRHVARRLLLKFSLGVVKKGNSTKYQLR